MITRVLLMAFVAAASACGSNPGSWTPKDGAFLRIVETDERFAIDHLSSGSYGSPDEPGDRRLVYMIASNGMHLDVSFVTDRSARALTVSVPSISSDRWQDAVNLIDLHGFEGGPRDLCTVDGPFPGNAGDGAVELTSLEINDDNIITEARGYLSVKLAGCTIPGTQVQGMDITLEGEF